MQQDLLRRLRWGNVARAAALVLAIAAVVAWPRLAPPDLALPPDRPRPAEEALGYARGAADTPRAEGVRAEGARRRPEGVRAEGARRRAKGARRRGVDRRAARPAPQPRATDRAPGPPARPAAPAPSAPAQAPPAAPTPANPAPSELAAPVVRAPPPARPEFGVEPGRP